MILNTGTRTDIPAFYSKWFLNRIEEGYVLSKNPYNNQIYKYNFDPKTVDVICFCSKNPKPLVRNLDRLTDYRQFWFTTINPYDNDIEVNVPSYKKVMKTFKELSEIVGINGVSWRYDPIFITEKYNLDFHIDKFEEMASELCQYTSDCTISFIDLYQKVLRNFPEASDVTTEERLIIGENFARVADEYGIQMKTCVEGTLLDQFGFDSSGCMTQQVLEKAIGNNLKVPKGKYHNRECNCLMGRDIGLYNTCMHGCKYCYANFSTKLVKRNFRLHDPDSPLLVGNVKENDTVKEIKEPSYIDTQQKLI